MSAEAKKCFKADTAVGIHGWKRNNLLSIGSPTVAYMVMVQFVFV